MIRWMQVARHERAVLVRGERVVRVLGAGRHLVWTWGAQVVRVDLTCAIHPAGIEDTLPTDVPGTEVIQLADGQCGVVHVDGVVRRVVGPGTWRIWADTGQVRVVVRDVCDEPVPLDGHDRLGVVGQPYCQEATADNHLAVVLSRDGVPLRTLPAGRYRVWLSGPWRLEAVALTGQLVELAPQDLVTRDQVPVRIKAVVRHRVVDALTAVREAQGTALLYAAAQLALRETIAGQTLDALVEAREALSEELLTRTRAALPPVGLAVDGAHVKDIILSAEVKATVHRVTTARKEAEAESIRRREEVASMRQLANTAKLLEANPILLRLKELEAMAELAARVDKLVVVGGSDLVRQVMRLDGDGP